MAPCADYLDLEPRLNLAEVEPRPDRLDRQLLEVMLSYHASGLAVVRRPEPAGRDAFVRSRRCDAIARPRIHQFRICRYRHAAHLVLAGPTAFCSARTSLFIVSETTVPGLRHAKQLVAAIDERLGEGPQPTGHRQPLRAAKCSTSGLRRGDIEQALGDAFLTCNSQRLRACPGSDRPRRSARRGQARQQDHRASSRNRARSHRRRNRPATASRCRYLKKLKLSLAW